MRQGQGARLISSPDVISQVFYMTIPGPVGGPLYWIVFIFAVLATVSQLDRRSPQIPYVVWAALTCS